MSSHQIRHFISLVYQTEAEPRSTPVVLTESALSDRVKAIMGKVSARYPTVTADLLGRTIEKARSAFPDSRPIAQALERITAAAKLARSNAALLLALVALAGTLVGLAGQPAAAEQAAQRIAQAATGDVDQIIAKLRASGIEVGQSDTALAGLPAGLSENLRRAAAALKAIDQFEFTRGLSAQSLRKLGQSVRIEAGVEVAHDSLSEEITLSTPDGKLVIARIQTEVRDGRVVSDTASGVRFDLLRMLDGLDEAQSEAVEAFLRSAVGGAAEAPGSPQAAVQGAAEGIALMVADLASRGETVATKVAIGPNGVKVA